MKAAKAGDSAAITKASADWYANGNQVADLPALRQPACLVEARQCAR